MQTYIALLRAVNLAGRNKVAMEDLRALFAEAGGEEVATYLQSGNVIFRCARVSAGDIVHGVEERLRTDLGLGVTVLLRTKAQLAHVVAANPFATSEREESHLHVTFLAEPPERARVRELEAKPFEPDEFRVVGEEVYLRCPNGYGRSKLTNAHFEKHLGVAATTRNWRTVTKLAELAGA